MVAMKIQHTRKAKVDPFFSQEGGEGWGTVGKLDVFLYLRDSCCRAGSVLDDGGNTNSRLMFKANLDHGMPV